ncbi:metallophosphoesterase [Methylomonas sp. MgM2]
MLKVLQITDLHIKPHLGDTMFGIDTEILFQQTLQHAHDQHGRFDLILLTGDLAQHPIADSYRRICQHLQSYNTRCLCLPGNHDDFGLMTIHLNQGVVSCDKVVQLKGWQIIALNSQKPGSPAGDLTSNELGFLEKCLQSSPELATLIAVHHHCIASGSPWLDTMQIRNSGSFLALIQAFPQVKAVTFGHIHQELSSTKDQMAIYGTPSSCFQFAPNSSEFCIENASPGYRIFELFTNGKLQSKCYRAPIKMDDLDINAHAY